MRPGLVDVTCDGCGAVAAPRNVRGWLFADGRWCPRCRVLPPDVVRDLEQRPPLAARRDDRSEEP